MTTVTLKINDVKISRWKHYLAGYLGLEDGAENIGRLVLLTCLKVIAEQAAKEAKEAEEKLAVTSGT